MGQPKQRNEPIAVIGSGCRFPGDVDSPSKLWTLLETPRDVQSKIPADRWNADAFYHPDGSHHGTTNVQHAYFLSGNSRGFDASFFKIKPHEADCIDPQQRLLLETVYDSLTAAGLKMESLHGSNTAAYVGVMSADYSDILYHDIKSAPTYTATGSARSIISNRLSYFFDWRGPSMTIDTACSSSLVAVHHAVQTLRNGESNVAIAAGANLMFSPNQFVVESKLSMLSPTGRSHMWDSAANGYARGEGIAAVVLKTLSQALEDGDHIECIIRETGINQDGRTTGITMPSHAAQEALIRETYIKAGLDPSEAADRCQYFEAHGTGTPAGDPQEAEAICKAFFPRLDGVDDVDNPLFVGSIKTVIGHTEGTAGLAGLLKASLAVQNGVIPPNMLFENLSPSIAPFYHNLRIATKSTPWPSVAAHGVRRASVNSFGFGGTNAHVILEEFQADGAVRRTEGQSRPSLTPMVVSAHSERALKESLRGLIEYLETNPTVALQDLTWTMSSRRSVLPYRKALPALSHEVLLTELRAQLETPGTDEPRSAVSHQAPKLLGVFTGQGAQWPAMGKALILSSAYARAILGDLDRSLATLPEGDRPSWTLYEEMSLEGDASHVKLAKYSQPLCTAVQILLVDILGSAGVQFKAVVGHSSGEIGCAYAAGCLTASEAIRIAYYRGLVTHDAGGSDQNKGAMMAVGTSMVDAQDLCDLEAFEGRVNIAAYNAMDSITLSGDLDAIIRAKQVCDDEGKFARLLKVDKAYHSHHMLPCATPYVRALTRCGLGRRQPMQTSTIWMSSVTPGVQMTRAASDAVYWKDNMVSPVYFAQALTATLTSLGPFDAVLEVGPHAALKGPALSTIETTLGAELPYTGCMARGTDDMHSLGAACGFLWEHFGGAGLDFAYMEAAVVPSSSPPVLIKDMPSYPWDHSRTYWHEPRLTKEFLHRPDISHPLLGDLGPNSSQETMQWSSLISPKELTWLEGHRLQGQIVLPAAAFAVMAMEAAMILAADRPVALIEVLDLTIGKAVTFDKESDSVETSFTLNRDFAAELDDSQSLELRFSCNTSLARESSMSWSAGGRVRLTFGPQTTTVLPSPQRQMPLLNEVSVDLFYTELDLVGYGYSKDFRGIEQLQRATNTSAGSLAVPHVDADYRPFVLHPAPLDVAFQAFIAAFCAPGDGRLWTLHVPTSIARIAINPLLAAQAQEHGSSLEFCSNIMTEQSDRVGGDIDVFTKDTHETVIQVEQISFKPFATPTAKDDTLIFSEWVWAPLDADAVLSDEAGHATAEEELAARTMERLTYFYVKRLIAELAEEDRRLASPHLQHMVRWAEHVLATAKSGKHPYYSSSWELDNEGSIATLLAPLAHRSDIEMVATIGKNLAAVVNDEVSPLELMTQDGLLSRFYEDALGFRPSYHYIGKLVHQIAHRFANVDVLEIGAGTGNCTKAVIPALGNAFNSYTFSDISSGFFPEAKANFSDERITYQVLDISQPILEQGFAERSYDVIIASNVLHATRSLDETMQNCRRLLRPGGYVILLEITSSVQSWISLIFGTVPGWWEGVDDGRVLGPTISIEKWDQVMQASGFQPLMSSTEQSDDRTMPISVFAARATDPEFDYLCQPTPDSTMAESSPMVLIGGAGHRSAFILEALQTKFPRRMVTTFSNLSEINGVQLSLGSTFVVISELDQELFASLTEESLEGVKTMFRHAKSILWITEDAYTEHPYQLMITGMCRTLRLEYPQCRLQLLDIEDALKVDTALIVKTVLQLEASHGLDTKQTTWTFEGELRLMGGELHVPRLKPDTARNNRYNSTRRAITLPVAPNLQAVHVRRSKGQYQIFTNPPAMEDRFAADQMTQVTVSFSLACAVRIGNSGFFHLALGRCDANGTPVLVLSTVNASVLSVPSDWVSELGFDARPAHLEWYASELVAQSILETVAARTTVLVLEPSIPMAVALWRRAQIASIDIQFVTSDTQRLIDPESASQPWTLLHPRMTHASLKHSLPSRIALFCDLSRQTQPGSLAQRVKTCLPPSCSLREMSDFFQDGASAFCAPRSETLSNLTTSSLDSISSLDMDSATIRLVDLESPLTPSSRTSGIPPVIDWTHSALVPACIVPIDTTNLFEDDKTYILVGLTGDLGRSLCRWMVQHGARYIVLLSRQPKVDPQWIQFMHREGATVVARAMNVAVKDSVKSVLESIEADLPPISGVAHGPLVLQDAMFENMDIETMESVLEAKVTGNNNLEEYFGSRELDFFVYFSSLVAAGGNQGQSNYAAANLYLSGATARRRKRGLAASCINIGAVTGVGFITRAARESDYSISKVLFMSVSEQDLHQQFGEAVVAGKPNSSGISFEITTGMPFNDPANRDIIPFIDDPRLGFYKLPEQRGNGIASQEIGGPVKDRVNASSSMVEARSIIVSSLHEKLKSALQLQTNEHLDLNSSLVDQGVDSLVAVTVRTWFSKELGVDIPVLKVLGGASITDLGIEASERLPPSIQPHGMALTSEPPVPAIDDQPGEAAQSNQSTESSGPSTQGDSGSDEDSDALPLPETPMTGLPIGHESEDHKEFDFPVVAAEELEYTSPLSFGQSRFGFLAKYVEDPTAFNVTIGMWLDGEIDLARLSHAVDVLTRRHETFRTRFGTGHSRELRQEIMRTSRVKLETIQCSSRDAAMAGFEELRRHTYNLETGDTTKMVIFSYSATNHFLVVGYHHIVLDGWGLEMVVKELHVIYTNRKLSPAHQYATFAARQRDEVETGVMDNAISYWRDQMDPLPTVIPLLPLATSTSRPAALSWNLHESGCRLEPVVAARIKDRSRKQKSNPFHFYLAAYYVLLARLSETEDVCIGIAEANRSGRLADSETLGFFINLLPVRLAYDPSQTFGDAIMHAREQSRGALANSSVPFDVLLEKLDVPRSGSYSPLFQAFLDYKQGQSESGVIGPSTISGVEMSRGRTNYDMALEVTEDPTKDPLINVKLQQGLYTQADANALLKCYINILTVFSRNPALRVDEPRLFSKGDVVASLKTGCGPVKNFSGPATLIEKILGLCEAAPEEPALHGEQTSFTRLQMADRINGVSAILLEKGIQPGDAVGVMQTAGPDWICSMLAIMNISGIYMPLDSTWPGPRLGAVLADGKPRAVLTETTLLESLSDLPDGISWIDIAGIPYKKERVPCIARAEQAAALLYTSGTTGKPKGLLLSHENLRNNIEGTISELGIGPVKTLQQSAYSFDLSLNQMFIALASGGSTVIVPDAKRRDPAAIAAAIVEREIQYTEATPSEYASWLSTSSDKLCLATSWTYALALGEVLPHSVLLRVRALQLESLRFFCVYGPAEITISSTMTEIFYKVELPSQIPSGRSLPNYSMYIVDHELKALPAGWPGEVLIGGVGTCLGYLNAPDTTKRQFIPDHFATPELAAAGHKTLFRSGDRGRLTPDGMLLFDGRIGGSTQIKLRGFRIELQDIENSIFAASRGSITRAIVSVRGEDLERYLVAYAVFDHSFPSAGRPAEMKRVLRDLAVPSYMRPARIFEVATFPLSAHGKIDRRTVDSWDLTDVETPSAMRADLTPTENHVWEIWCTLLPSEMIIAVQPTADTDFFSCGGNSILMVQLQALLKEKTNTAISLLALFEGSTLGEIAAKCDHSSTLQSINWVNEGKLDMETIQQFVEKANTITRAKSGSRKDGLTVATTGASGYVGRHVVEMLLGNPQIRRIHCLASRGEFTQHAKLEFSGGDLRLPLLGLSDERASEISGEIDVIVHAGGSRSFWDSYEDLRAVNVGSTKEVLKLAAPKKVPVIFISSAASALKDFDATQASGYISTKFVSEMALENGHGQLGISTNIVRMSSRVSGNEVDAKRAEDAVLGEIVRMEKLLKTRLDLNDLSGRVAFSPTGTVAQRIADMTIDAAVALQSKSAPSSTSSETEIIASCVLSAEKYQEFLSKAHLADTELLALPSASSTVWMGMAKRSGFDYFITAQDYTVQGQMSSR